MRYMSTMSAHVGTANFPRFLMAAILVASVGVLAAALIGEHVFGLEPCELCLYQRVPFVVTGALAGLGLILSLRGKAGTWPVAACAVVFFASAGLAFYHVGVEQHWWASVTACGGDLSSGLSIEELQKQLSAPPRKPCDQVDWTFLGLSLAGYNVIASLILAVACVVGARRIKRDMKTWTRKSESSGGFPAT
jgi:disulfide bond formation protein DsbB